MNKKVIFSLILLSIFIAFLSGFLASSSPDGLEKVAENLGFSKVAKQQSSVFIDYNFSEAINPAISKIFAGIFGILIIYFIIHSFIHLKHLKVIIAKIFRIDNWLDRKNKE